MANGNGNGVKLSRATLALIVAIAAPVAGGAVAVSKISAVERRGDDHEQRIRPMEIAIVQIDQMRDTIEKQTVEIEKLREAVQQLQVEVRRR